jgi:hypothetical protein
VVCLSLLYDGKVEKSLECCVCVQLRRDDKKIRSKGAVVSRVVAFSQHQEQSCLRSSSVGLRDEGRRCGFCRQSCLALGYSCVLERGVRSVDADGRARLQGAGLLVKTTGDDGSKAHVDAHDTNPVSSGTHWGDN